MLLGTKPKQNQSLFVSKPAELQTPKVSFYLHSLAARTVALVHINPAWEISVAYRTHKILFHYSSLTNV